MVSTLLAKIKTFIQKYEKGILYLFFGGLTTAINFITYLLLTRGFSVSYVLANVVAWIAAVLFAYLTNRKWVFRSKENKPKNVFKEITLFFLSRLFSGVVETALLVLMIEVMLADDVLAKIIVAVITVILNYLTSQYIVFRKKKKS